ncbi:MAG: hypothetical protein J6Y64_05855, partial [Ruminococcus sp.]|nr:hypothetical protein [Ruminococcus sp.]
DILNDSDGEETLKFENMQPSEIVFTTSTSDRSLTLKNINTGDKVTIKKFNSDRYTFVFGTDNFIVTRERGYPEFTKK